NRKSPWEEGAGAHENRTRVTLPSSSPGCGCVLHEVRVRRKRPHPTHHPPPPLRVNSAYGRRCLHHPLDAAASLPHASSTSTTATRCSRNWCKSTSLRNVALKAARVRAASYLRR